MRDANRPPDRAACFRFPPAEPSLPAPHGVARFQHVLEPLQVVGDRVWDSRELALIDAISERVWLWVDHLEVLAKLKDAAVATAIQRTEAKYQALVESVRDYAILTLDPNGIIRSLARARACGRPGRR